MFEINMFSTSGFDAKDTNWLTFYFDPLAHMKNTTFVLAYR